MTTLIKYLIVSVASFLIVQCTGFTENSVDGVGAIVQLEVPIKAHEKITLEKGWKVVLIPSEENKIFIEANENLINDELQLKENENGLTISAKRNIRRADSKIVQVFYNSPIQQVEVNSSASLLHSGIWNAENLRLEVSSGAQIELTLNTQTFTSEISSGASVTLSGEVQEAQIEASSGALLKAENLVTEVVRVEASSGANVHIYASKDANASASSGAIVKISGEPAILNKSTNSGGSVKRIETIN